MVDYYSGAITRRKLRYMIAIVISVVYWFLGVFWSSAAVANQPTTQLVLRSNNVYLQNKIGFSFQGESKTARK